MVIVFGPADKEGQVRVKSVGQSQSQSVRPSVKVKSQVEKKKFVRLIRPQRRFIPITKTTTPLLIPVYILTNMYS